MTVIYDICFNYVVICLGALRLTVQCRYIHGFHWTFCGYSGDTYYSKSTFLANESRIQLCEDVVSYVLLPVCFSNSPHLNRSK